LRWASLAKANALASRNNCIGRVAKLDEVMVVVTAGEISPIGATLSMFLRLKDRGIPNKRERTP
jgi:hypothetical protein